MSVTLDGTNGLTFNDSTKMESANSLGMRNRIINGDMQIMQRGNITVASGTQAYTLDRFLVQPTGSSTAVGQGGPPTGYSFSLNISPNGATSNLNIQQRIEASNCFDLANKTVTLSGWVFQSTGAAIASITVRLFAPTAVNNYAGITQQGSTYTIPSIAPNGWNYFSAQFALGAGAINGLTFLIDSNTTITSGQALAIAGVQLELGTVATPFERRAVGLELALCQRYYQQYITPPLRGITSNNPTIVHRMGMILPVAMRVAATTIIVGALPIYDGSTTTTVSSVAATYATTTSIEFDFSLAGALASYLPAMIYTSGTATVTLSSEL